MTQQPPIAEGLQQVTGASATQTGLSQAEPEVSALRASIPSADELVSLVAKAIVGEMAKQNVAGHMDQFAVARAAIRAMHQAAKVAMSQSERTGA